MVPFIPLRTLPQTAPYKKGDVLVVFGELFSRGYANGIVDEAEKAGLKVIRATVGRRDETGKLRPLNEEELKNQPQPLINIPLEAGFDMEPCEQDGSTPIDQLKGLKIGEWDKSGLDWDKIKSSRKRATERFRTNVAAYLKELQAHIPKGANVLIAHTMAGGVPRAKIMMPTMNRVFKGTGDRHLASETFWKSELGQLTAQNFEDVTAQTFHHLIDLSQGLRSHIESSGGSVHFVAYGYHGTEVLIRGEYQWQSYAPYVQGYAKMMLENFAMDASKKGVSACVFNCPEILTNSSSIFVGVEVPLYPFISALREELPKATQEGRKKIQETLEKCQALLAKEASFEQMMKLTDTALSSDEIRRHSKFEGWPQHNGKEQMETLIQTSENLIEMHADPKSLITFVLSEEIFRATGYVMFHESWKPSSPVLWLGHDVLAKALASGQTL